MFVCNVADVPERKAQVTTFVVESLLLNIHILLFAETSPKCPVAETAIAEASRRRDVPSPKQPSPRRNGVAETASLNRRHRIGIA